MLAFSTTSLPTGARMRAGVIESVSCGWGYAAEAGATAVPDGAAGAAGVWGKYGSVSTGGATGFCGGATSGAAGWSFGQIRQRSPLGSILGQRNPAHPATSAATRP